MTREKKRRIVVDTNVFVSGTLFPEGNEAIILDQVFNDNVRLLTSLEILEEYREVLSRDKFELASTEVQSIFRKAVSHSEIILGVQDPIVKCRDPDDQKFLDTAFNGKADYIVTGDPDLLDVEKINDTRIVTAAIFLRILRKNRSSSGPERNIAEALSLNKKLRRKASRDWDSTKAIRYWRNRRR